MELSLYLAKVIGVFYLLWGLALLLNHKTYTKMENKLLKNKPVSLMFGLILMPAGLYLAIGHYIWEFSWVGLITLFGWIVFIKGALIVVFPDILEGLKKRKFSDSWLYVGGVIGLVIGLYLTYVGFFS